jgi:S1-C subfamily serine protease
LEGSIDYALAPKSEINMRQRLQFVIGCANAVITAAVLLVSLFFCNFAQAEDVPYATIGWWRVIYREVANLTGCQATARFDDETVVAMALIQDGNGKGWNVFISNPKWDSWVRRKSQHTLFIVAINPNKLWRGPWSVNGNNELHIASSIEFVNSLADAKALAIYDESKRLLTAQPLNMKDSETAIRAVVTCVRDHSSQSYSPPPQTPPQATSSFSGTAFFVAPNFLVTNNHVVKECRSDIQVRYPDRRSYTATISGRDETNDLALLQTEMSNQSVAIFRSRARLGEPAATYGFPYSDILSSSGNFTTGNVTALSGLRNDSRFIQIQVPVQPGNSGGPLLDMSGGAIGVVTLRLDALAMMEGGGGVPQNINFAIHAPIVLNFLSAKGVTPKLDSSDVHRDLTPSDVAEMAKKFTVQVYCEAAPSRTSRAAPPPPGASPNNAFEQEAKDFVVALQARWSGPNREALAGLEALYDDEVVYYGKLTKKNMIIKEKEAFVRKFPEREYKPKNISISCSDRVCTVRGLVDFRAVDPVAKILSEGVASFEYQVIMSGVVLKIVVENGEVLSRTRTPLPDSTTSQSYSFDTSASQLYSGASAVEQYKGSATWQPAR